jgi:hypothetical protein
MATPANLRLAASSAWAVQSTVPGLLPCQAWFSASFARPNGNGNGNGNGGF